MKNFWSKYGAYLAAAVMFVVLALAYCKPELEGKVVNAGDGISANSAVQESVRYSRQTGDCTWWTGSMFSGMPNYQIGGGHYKSLDLIAWLNGPVHKGHSSPVWVFIIYFFCFFVLMRSFGIDKWLSIVGAVATALSTYFIVIIAAGHNGKTSTIALMALVFAGEYLIFRKKYAPGIIFSMLFTAVGFSTHPQMAYYMFMLMGVMWFSELAIHIKGKRIKDLWIGTALFAASVTIGLGCQSANVFVNSEYASQTMRGGHSDIVRPGEETAAADQSKGLDLTYATQWSYGIDETMSFLIPGFMGGASGVNVGKDSESYKALVKNGVPSRSASDFCKGVPLYWGEQPFTAGNVYMGAIVCLLFLLGLMIVPGPHKWGLLAATLFSIMLAWGCNFMPLTRLFFNWFPLYNKFRAVSSILIVAEITMPLLGFLAVKALMDGTVDRKKAGKSILIAAGVTGGICVFFALLGPVLFDFRSTHDAAWSGQLPGWLYTAIQGDRKNLLCSDSWRSALFIAGAAFVLWLYSQGKLKNGVMIAILGVLVLADLWPVDRRYFNDGNFVARKQNNAVFEQEEWEKALLADEDPDFRIFNLTTSPFNDARSSHYLKSIGGYHAAKLRRYQDLIDEHLSKMHMPVINMLNTKYFIVKDDDGLIAPQYNPGAMGNAWWVENLITVKNANEESDALMQVDLHKTAVLDESFASFVSDYNPGVAEDATVRLTRYTPKSVEYACHSSKPGTIVLSEIYYPFGWKTFIDGKPAGHYRVDYMLRAINVPAGDHDVKMIFDPDSVRKGNTLSIICIIIMYMVSLGLIAWEVRKRIGK